MTIDRGSDNAIGNRLIQGMINDSSPSSGVGVAGSPAAQPHRIGPLVAPLIAAGASIVSSLISSNFSKHQAEKQMAWQTKEQEKQNKWQADQMDKANAYNSPAQQMARFRDAGINPYLMFDSGGSGMTGNYSPLGASGSGVSSVGLPQAPSLLQSGDIGNLAGALKSIADAKKSGVETSRLEAFTDAELQNLQLDAAQKKFNLQLDQLYGDKQRNANLNKTIAENGLLLEQALTVGQQGNLYQFDLELKQLEKKLLEDKINKGYVDIFIDNLKRYGKLLSAQTKNQNASAVNQFAQAGQAVANTETINQSRQEIINNLKSQTNKNNKEAMSTLFNTYLTGLGLTGDAKTQALGRLLHAAAFSDPDKVEAQLDMLETIFGNN